MTPDAQRRPGDETGATQVAAAAGTKDTVAAARRLAGRGWPVFPCRPLGKEPLTGRGFHDATLDPATIRAWWQRWPTANVGVHTGGAGLCVLDLDVDKTTGTPVGFPTMQAHADAGRVPQAWITSTWYVMLTPRGGEHHYYLDPEGVMRPSTELVGPGVDIRAAGSYVVAAGAVRLPDGRIGTYRPLTLGPVGPLPEWLPRLVTAAAPAPVRRSPPGPRTRERYHGLERFLRDSREGNRHDRLHWVLRRLHEDGQPMDRAAAECATIMVPLGLDRRHVDVVARSIWGRP